MTPARTTQPTKDLALSFLRAARAGDRAKAESLLAPGATHHNAYFPAGMPALLNAMMAAAADATDRTFTPLRVLADGDLVAVHSRVHHHPGDRGVAVVHIFRFEGEKIAELWDVGQLVPESCPNADGMF
jgi:predicted SnoaL-like aldol condensation-catalyzing enzyme